MTFRKALPLASVVMFAGVAGILGNDGENPQLIYLWKNGAPGFEARKDEKETVKYGKNDPKLESVVSNVHNPSITVYLPPKEKATGAALVILPGGGHKNLQIGPEGHAIAKWLNERGIAGIVLKYRLFRETKSAYKDLLHEPLDDTQRAIRMTRFHAKDWNIDKAKVGIIGYSAGGELVGYAATNYDSGKQDAPDPIDREGCRPDFQVLIYPGPLGLTKEPGKPLTKDVPSAFIAVGADDGSSVTMAQHFIALKKAGVSVELHIFADTPHAFNMANGPKWTISTKGWLNRLTDWMTDKKFLPNKTGAAQQ
jgi:acetyl esterase/lipase